MGSHCAETKKNKVIWTPDLHKKFLEAIEKLGVNEAVPRKILELMKVEGLTRDHIASHLQKYRIFLKKIVDANYQVQITSKPILLESSMINGDPWKNSLLMHNQPTPQQKNMSSYNRMHAPMNPPVLDTSTFSFPVLEASSFNTTSSKLAHSHSLPNPGYSMQTSNMLVQTMHNNFDHAAKLNVTNSSFMHNIDGFMYDNGGSTIDLHPYVSSEIGSSNGLYSMNHENLTNNGDYFVQGSNGFESNYSSNGEFVEMGSLYGSNSNNVNQVSTYWNNMMEMNTDPLNLQKVIGEDDLILDAAYISSLWDTFFPGEPCFDYNDEHGSTSNNVNTLETPYQDVINGQNLPNMVSFDSIYGEDHVNRLQHSNDYGKE